MGQFGLEKQKVLTLIRLLLFREQSDLSLHCLLCRICPNNKHLYGNTEIKLSTETVFIYSTEVKKKMEFEDKIKSGVTFLMLAKTFQLEPP